MFCPNCGIKTPLDQKFCRSCGFSLEKTALSLAEYLPTQRDESLQERKNRLDRLRVAALSVCGAGILSIILYKVVYGLMLTQGRILEGLGLLAVIIILGCIALAVILQAKVHDVEQTMTRRRLSQSPETDLAAGEATGKLLSEGDINPIPSVTERTTELLFAEKKKETGS